MFRHNTQFSIGLKTLGLGVANPPAALIAGINHLARWRAKMERLSRLWPSLVSTAFVKLSTREQIVPSSWRKFQISRQPSNYALISVDTCFNGRAVVALFVSLQSLLVIEIFSSAYLVICVILLGRICVYFSCIKLEKAVWLYITSMGIAPVLLNQTCKCTMYPERVR